MNSPKVKNPKNKQKENGFAFAITVLGSSLIVGLIVVFIFNTVNTGATIAGRTMAARIAYWKALSRISMLDQLINDYGYDDVSEGGLLEDLTFEESDDCNKRIVSVINISELTRTVEGVLHNNNCDVETFPNYSMIYRVSQNWQYERGNSRGWRHISDGTWQWHHGQGTNQDIWGWHWNVVDPDGGPGADDSLSIDYGNFLFTGWEGRFDGNIYIGSNIEFDVVNFESKPEIGKNPDYTTHIMVPDNAAVVPENPFSGNQYTWETVERMDLPDFDHTAYDSLLNVAANVVHNPSQGKYIGDIDWNYDGEFDETTIFYLHNYPQRTLYVNGDVRINNATVLNVNGSASNPGIIVATGNINIDGPAGNSIPDNIILVSGGNVDLRHTNFGTVMDESLWSTVVNEVYARGQIDIQGDIANRDIFAQLYAFGGGDNHKSISFSSANIYGIMYAPNHESYVEYGNDTIFKGAMYINQIMNNTFNNDTIVINHKFPSKYFNGGLVGLEGLTESWTLVSGSIREI